MPDATVPFHLTGYFSTLRDPRVARTRRHDFGDVILLTLISILCGADNFVEVERFAKANQDWFQTFLPLHGGIPSHDTIARLFARLAPQSLSEALSSWIQQVSKRIDECVSGEGSPPKPDHKIYAIDGKCLCDSFDRVAGQKALHLVSVFCTRYNIVLAQQKVDEKSNEQTAIEPLLNQIDVAGATLTLDAMHTQKETTHAIRDRGADYVIGLKSNQPRLLEDVTGFFDRADQRGFWTEEGEPLPHGKTRTRNIDHGRYETRDYVCAPAPAWLDSYDEWADMKTIIRVDRTRQIGTAVSSERSYYISSLPPESKRLPYAIRSHWSIENNLHWVLDVAFDEDHCRARKGHEAENLASIRRFVLSLLKTQTNVKVGFKAKRKMAGWDINYRNSVVSALCI